MIKDKRGHKMTPTQVAKELIVQQVDDAIFWCDLDQYEKFEEMLTEKEFNAIDDALRKQRRRVRKLLGYETSASIPRLI
tara:strand:- start:337 stop:573 length:237 start_codon:yes stop_codon:yes gene_type:complete